PAQSPGGNQEILAVRPCSRVNGRCDVRAPFRLLPGGATVRLLLRRGLGVPVREVEEDLPVGRLDRVAGAVGSAMPPLKVRRAHPPLRAGPPRSRWRTARPRRSRTPAE